METIPLRSYAVYPRQHIKSGDVQHSFVCHLYISVGLAVFSKFAPLTLANLEKGFFCFVRQNQRNADYWVILDCNFRYIRCTNFFELHCAFCFFYFAFFLFILLCQLECAGVFRLCGGDHGLCPLDSHKPLKRLDRNFYMGCALCLRPRRLAIPRLTASFMPPP